MTKNKFLSKRLACLLTTALIASPIFLINNKPAYAANVTIAANGTYADADKLHATTDNIINTTNGTIATANAALTVTTITNINTGTLTLTSTGTSGELIVLGDITAAASTTSTIAMGTTELSLSGNVVATGTPVITMNGATTATLKIAGAAAKTIAATIDGAGIISITGTPKTFSRAIGSSTAVTTITGAASSDTIFSETVNASGVISHAGTAGGMTFAKDVTAGSIAIVDGSALTFSGTTAQTVTGAITGTGATGTGLGTISISNAAGNVTFANAIGADATQVLSLTAVDGAKIKLNAANNFVDKIVIGAGSEVTLGKAIVNGATVFQTDSGQTTGDAIAASTAATSKFYMPANLTNGQTLTLINTTNGTDLAAGIGNMAVIATDLNTSTGLQNTALTTYSASAATTGTVVVTSTDKSASTTASELGVNTNKASALLQARNAAAAANTAATDTSSIDAIYNVLNAQGGQSATADTAFANQVSPQTDTITGSTIAAKAVTSGVQNVISTRLASLRSGDAYSTGVVTGSGMSANSGFVQAFGSQVEQKNKGNEFGYDADTTGFAIGFDTKVPGGAVIGISYAHSEADVDGKGTGRAKNDIKTDSVSLYADYATKAGYVEGSITYGKSDNKGSRVINTGGLTNTYTSNSDSEQYSFRLSGGIPQSLGGGAFFTPFAAATISQIKADAYTESSTTANDALRLRVSQDTVDSQVGSVGVKFHQAIKDGKTTFTPEVKLAVNQEFGDDTITSTNTYQGGGTSFKNSTAIEKTSATAGVGLNISSDNVSFNIGYEADVRDKYLGHSAQAKITAKF